MPFSSIQLVVDDYGMVHYAVSNHGNTKDVTPEVVGAHVISTLRQTAEANLSRPVKMAVMSVPAEFDETQRNYTRQAAKLAGRIFTFSTLIHMGM